MASTIQFVRKTKNYQSSCRHIAERRETTFAGIPIERLIPLGVCANVSHFKFIDPQDLAERVCQIYDPSYLYYDWQRYCNALESEQKALATIEGALYFAKESLPPSTNRDLWIPTCLNIFYSLKLDAETGQRLKISDHPAPQTRMNSIPVQHIRASQTFFDVTEPDVVQTRPSLFRETLQKFMENEEALKTSTENQEFLPAFGQSPVQLQKRRRIEYESGKIGSMTNESPPSNKNVTSSLTREVQHTAYRDSTQANPISRHNNRQNPLTIQGLLEPTSQPILPGTQPPDQVWTHGNRDETKSTGMVATNRASIMRGRPSLPLQSPSSENREFKHMYTNAPVGIVSKLPQQIRTAIENSALWKWERDQGLQVTGCLATLFPKSNQQDVSFTIWCGNKDGYDLIEAFGLQLDMVS